MAMKLPFWLKAFIIFQTVLLGVLIWITFNNTPIIKSIVGPIGLTGERGKPGVDGYTPRKSVDYFDGLKGDKGDKGDAGEQGPQGIPGLQGEPGPQGEQGETGQNGKKVEFRCRDFNTKPSQIQYRYEGDEFWQTLYEIQGKCDL